LRLRPEPGAPAWEAGGRGVSTLCAHSRLETYSEPVDEHQQQPELPFELVETTFMKLTPMLKIQQSGLAEAELVAIISATRQSLNHLLTGAAVCLRWRHAASRAAERLKTQCAVIMTCCNKHSELLTDSVHLRGLFEQTVLPGLFTMKNFTERNLIWFRRHGAGWELNNTLHVPDGRFIARIGEFAIIAKIEESREEGASHERLAKGIKQLS
jgi:hypothetical protein